MSTSFNIFQLIFLVYQMDDLDSFDLAKRFTHSSSEHVFQAHFGGPSIAINCLARKILQKCTLPPLWNLDHLFMCLFFLKAPSTSLEVLASRFNISKGTFERKLWDSLSLIDEVLPEVK
jgi:hypothetical protein